MFTGIITHLGKVQTKTNTSLTIQTSSALVHKMQLGTSVAIDGICLTVTALPTADTFAIEYMPETARKTNIHTLAPEKTVNLELSMSADGLFAGHIVQGHIDTTATIRNITPEENSHLLTIAIDPQWTIYMVNKGSIAVNGISLTIIDVLPDGFTVGIIPHTWSHTMLQYAQIHDTVNIEVDMIAKHVHSMLQRTHGKITA